MSIDNFKGTWLISVRKWFKADDGQLRPGKGLAMGAKNLPPLAKAISQALSTARERSLISADDGRDQG